MENAQIQNEVDHIVELVEKYVKLDVLDAANLKNELWDVVIGYDHEDIEALKRVIESTDDTVTMLKGQLAATDDEIDAERSKRYEVEDKLEKATDTLHRIAEQIDVASSEDDTSLPTERELAQRVLRKLE